MKTETGQEIKNKHTIEKFSIGMLGAVGVMSLFYYRFYLKEVYRLNRTLEQLSEIDPLTKLLNKRGLMKYMEGTYEKMQDRLKAIYMIDIDCFKLYNDYYGHEEGDKVLEEVAKVLKNVCKRSTDRVVRYGGEEFLIILEGENEQDFFNMANKIRRSVENRAIVHKCSAINSYVTVSIGMAIGCIKTEESYKKLVKKADRALYVSKRSGKNRCTYCKG